MKRAMLLLLPLTISGCLAEVLTTTAIQGELAARDAQASAQALRYTQESKAKIEGEQAIRAYQAEHGNYPPSLAALVPGYLANIPLHADGRPYGYDAATGQLLDRAAPAAAATPFTATDQQNLERIGDAIYRFWESTGYYPQSLDDLDPIYMELVPTLGSGDPFLYDPQTGAVFPPDNAQGTPVPPAGGGAARRGVAGGGAGPLGEAMTGIAIQNELSNMNTNGVAGAGNFARGALDRAGGSHSDQQDRALDQIDQ
jgi:hypothetical protein